MVKTPIQRQYIPKEYSLPFLSKLISHLKDNKPTMNDVTTGTHNTGVGFGAGSGRTTGSNN